MAAGPAATVTRRGVVPSEREAAVGIVADTVAIETPTVLDVVRRSRWRDVLDATRPSIATGHHPTTPAVVLALPGLAREAADAVRRVVTATLIVQFGISVHQLSTLATVAAIGSVAVALLYGYIGDRIPRLWIIGGATLAYALGFFAYGISPTYAMFVFFWLWPHLVAGLNVLGPAGTSLLSDYYPPEVRGRVLAFTSNISVALGIPLVFAAGFVAQWLGIAHALLVASVVAGLGAGSVLLVREPPRGRWDRLRLGASDATASRELRKPSFAESLRIVRSVATLRRICLAQVWLSAGGLIIAPLVTINAIQVVGTDPVLQGIIAAASTVLTMVSFLLGGYFSDRYLNERPHLALPVLGWVYAFNIGVFALIGFVRVPWFLLTMSFVQALVSQIPTTGSQVVTSQVTPANVRTFGITFPQLYGVIGLVVTLPFIYVLPQNFGALFLFAAVLCAPGAVLLLTAKVDVERDIRAARLAVRAEEDATADGSNRLLVARGVEVEYDGIQVLFGVDFDLDVGELVALLGTNGAGKSTLLRAIAGLADPSGGAIYLCGRDTTHAPPHELAALGVVSMPGGKGVFPTLSVGDNLRTAGWLVPASEAKARIDAAFDFFPRLRERHSTLAGNLSGGEQQMLALAQAMVMKPRLLLVDELSLGLAPAIVEQLLQALVTVHEGGTTVVLVEQSVDLALSVAQRAVFMEKGEIRFDGPAEDLRRRPDLLRSVYLKGTRSRGAARLATRRRSDAGTVVLDAERLSVSYGGVRALCDASIQVNAGEIVGLIGPNGAGKTTLFDAICGFLPTIGVVRVAGRDVSTATPAQRSALGLARSFQDARLFPALSVLENVLLALHRHGGLETSAALSALWLPQSRRAEAKLRARAEGILDSVGLADDRDKVPAELSTGMRRVLDLGCMMAAQPDVLLLDEPSSGIAQAEAEELAPLLDRIRRELGCGLLLIEHDMSLLTAVADRLVGMVLGETIVTGTVDEVTGDERMIAAYLGTSRRVLARTSPIPEATP